MTINNPAAILAALTFAGSEDPMADLQEILAREISRRPELPRPGVSRSGKPCREERSADAAVAAFTPGTDGRASTPFKCVAEAVTALPRRPGQAQIVADESERGHDRAGRGKGHHLHNGSIDIPNVAPDEGLSAPFNAWMTFFGQFFDHGLDLISKGGNGTVYVPLATDDPLVLGADGQPGTATILPPTCASWRSRARPPSRARTASRRSAT